MRSDKTSNVVKRTFQRVNQYTPHQAKRHGYTDSRKDCDGNDVAGQKRALRDIPRWPAIAC